MWHFEDGDRVLTEGEWAFLSGGVELLADMIDDDLAGHNTNSSHQGHPAWDNLSPEQKMLILAEVASALHLREIPSPVFTAVNEAALASVVDVAGDMVQLEAKESDSIEMRMAVLAAAGALIDEEGQPVVLPEATDRGAERWSQLCGIIEGRLFWDRDFDDVEILADLPPAEAKAKREMLGIDEQYFLWTPPEPTIEQVNEARQRIRELCREN